MGGGNGLVSRGGAAMGFCEILGGNMSNLILLLIIPATLLIWKLE